MNPITGYPESRWIKYTLLDDTVLTITSNIAKVIRIPQGYGIRAVFSGSTGAKKLFVDVAQC